MSDELRARITADMKDAMRAKDSKKLGVIRLVQAAIKQIEVDQRITLNDNQIVEVIEKMLKQRRGSIVEFEKAGRDDLIAQEQFEIDLIQDYLPEQLSDTEVTTIIKAAISESGAASVKDMGNVMAVIKPQLQGKADMGKVSAQVKELLGA